MNFPITPQTLILLGITVVILLFISKGLVIVQQSETMIIERLGRYHSTLRSGINIIIPFLDKARPIIWRYSSSDARGRQIVRFASVKRIDLRETVYDYARQSVITRDNVVTEINAVLYFQIVDPKRAIYEISNLPQAIEMLTQTSLRNVIGEMDLDGTLTSRDTINNKLREILDEATNKWGVKVNRVELQDINPPQDIRDAMEKQMRAERDKRAKILQAEGMRESVIRESEGKMQEQINHAEGKKRAEVLAAEAERQAKILRAEGDAAAIEKIRDVVGEKGDPLQYLIAMKYLETLGEISCSPGQKQIYLPYEASGILAALGGIKDISGGKLPPLPPIAK